MDAPSSDLPRICWARGPRLRVFLVLAMFALVGFAGVRAAPATPVAALVKEINPAQMQIGYYGLVASDLVAAGDKVFLRSGDPENGNELWVSDGTTAGTRLVYDITAGTESSSLSAMTTVGERLFFVSWDAENGSGLWVSDGTAAGTARLNGAFGFPEQLTNVNGVLFFISSTGLWRSDGTAIGTNQVKDFGDMPAPTNLTNVAGKLFFIASDAAHGRELWVSDGTAAGTTIVADLNPGGDSFSRWYSAELTAVGGTLYFITNEAPLLYQLWRSDGTAAGTWRVTSASPSGLIEAEELEPAGPALYFRGRYSPNGISWATGLWKTDGSPAGTTEISTGVQLAPRQLLGVGSRLFFAGPESTLWTSDGTPGGTIQLGSVNVSESSFTGVADASGRLFFAGTDAAGDVELWVSDGTAAGTRRVKNINATDSSAPGSIAKLGSSVLFSANGGQLWRSDGTEAGTVLIKDPAVAPLGIYWYPTSGNLSYQMAEAYGKLFFAADDGSHGSELWVSDGTFNGTQLVKDINPSGSSFPMFLTPLGGVLFFMTGDPTSFVLWKTDGTEAGTSIVKSFADTRIPVSGGMIRVGTALYFLARDPSGDKLWRSDGTSSGTAPVASFPPADQPPSNLIGVNGRLFFVATDSAHGRELWASDGSAAGTKMVKDILLGPGDSRPFGLSAVNSTLFFMVGLASGSNPSGYELWKSDGSAAGTTQVKALEYGQFIGGWQPADFTPSGSRLFFSAGSYMDGRQLWVSDGTAAGTEPVKDSAAHAIPDPHDMAGVQGRLLFSRNDGVHGRELWVSDGTPSGTALVKDINPGSSGSALSGIRQVRADGWALFAASAGPDGVELWQTDGTPARTQQLQDIAPGAGSSNPVSFVGAGPRVYFIADDGRSGPELWSLNQAIFQDLTMFKRYLPLIKR